MNGKVGARTMREGDPDAPTAVLVHGIEDSWMSWQALAGALDPSWRAVALDMPWRTGNDYRWRTRSAGQWLADALALLDRTPDVLVAHSFGAGAVLQMCSTGAGDVAATIVLICPIYRTAAQAVTWQMFERSRVTYSRHIRDGVRARIGARAARMESGVLDGMMDLALERAGPSGFFTVFDQYLISPSLPLADIEQPVLVIVGDEDQTLTPDAALALAAAMPDGTVRAHENYDHFCHIRQAAGVATQVADFHRVAQATVRTARPRP